MADPLSEPLTQDEERKFRESVEAIADAMPDDHSLQWSNHTAQRLLDTITAARADGLREAATVFLDHVERTNLGMPHGCDGTCDEGRTLRVALTAEVGPRA